MINYVFTQKVQNTFPNMESRYPTKHLCLFGGVLPRLAMAGENALKYIIFFQNYIKKSVNITFTNDCIVRVKHIHDLLQITEKF